MVIVHPQAPAVTRELLADIYLGRSQLLTPIDLPDTSATYAEFYRRATGRDVAQVKSTWSRIIFSGKGLAPRQMGDASAVKRAVASDTKAVGYIERTALDASVKAVLTLE
ncbi:hypothetical protein [Ideonella paludis]|uniref:hypothetical protein n=1 Tax=Ideonella paludis TaxID=1233411 RepID=UPI0028734B3A|nr:hypothetical protein [Ideonella paludis]